MQVEHGRSGGAFKATMQAVVSERAVTVAVARLPVDDSGNLCSHLVGGHLIRMREVSAGELVAAEDRGSGLAGASAL